MASQPTLKTRITRLERKHDILVQVLRQHIGLVKRELVALHNAAESANGKEKNRTQKIRDILTRFKERLDELEAIVTNRKEEKVKRWEWSIAIFPLIEHAFDEEELISLCFDLDVNYDDLIGETHSNKSRSLITYFERRKSLDQLLDYCRKLRPNYDWPELPQTKELVL